MKRTTVISVQIYCCKCKQDVMKAAAGVDGVDSIQVDSSKNTVTVIGEADPVEVAKKIRKLKKNAEIVTVKTAG
ncbi:hypothetical protein SUGI_0365540 [Cryptomeria japonica]|nr:hypothetical protein SUGI_0365540 [Cryptomeria japonica]